VTDAASEVKFVEVRPEGISAGTSDGAPVLCGACGAYKATHFYDVWMDEMDEWVPIRLCAACALVGEAARAMEGEA
jgi:hypothetical protein